MFNKVLSNNCEDPQSPNISIFLYQRWILLIFQWTVFFYRDSMYILELLWAFLKMRSVCVCVYTHKHKVRLPLEIVLTLNWEWRFMPFQHTKIWCWRKKQSERCVWAVVQREICWIIIAKNISSARWGHTPL